jgi:hypothetical protein
MSDLKSRLLGLYWSLGIDLNKLRVLYRTIPRVWRRPFDHLQLEGIGAEIGVFSGFHARDLLKHHPKIKRLHLVDPYKEYSAACGHLSHLDRAEIAAHCNVRKYAKRVEWHRATAQKAVLPMLDFAYIDANHDYESVAKDITTIWGRIRRGGIIGGHDFHSRFPGVVKAVLDFKCLTSQTVHIETPDWWIIKE